MKLKSKDELHKLTTEELETYNKELADFRKRQKLLADAEEGSLEITKADPLNDLDNIQKEAEKGNKNPELVKELVKIKAEMENLRKESKPTFGTKHFEKEIEKSFGSKGKEVISIAKDLAQALPALDLVATACKMKVTDLEAFKSNFGIDREQFSQAVKAIEMQNKSLWIRSQMGLRTKTGLDTSDSSEWIPVGFESAVMDAILKAKGVAANLPSFDMPTQTFDWPVNNGNNTSYYVTESLTGGNITVAANNINAGKTTWASKKIANRQDLSEEMNEDTAFALLPALQRMMIDGLSDGFERVCLFGDTQGTTTNINYNGGSVTTTAGAADVFLATQGLVYKALVSSNGSKKDVNGAASPSSAIAQVLGQMGEGAQVPNLVIFVPPSFYFAALDDSAVKSVQNYGSGATILSGEVGRVFGIPIIMTSGIPLTGSDGKVDGVTSGNNIMGSFAVVNKAKVMIGFRRRIKVASQFFVVTDNTQLVASMRFDIQQFGANVSGKNPIGYGYNYPV